MDLRRIKDVLACPDSNMDQVAGAVQPLVTEKGVTEENTMVIYGGRGDHGKLAVEYRDWARAHSVRSMRSFRPRHRFPSGVSGDDYVMLASMLALNSEEVEVLADFYYSLGGRWDKDGKAEM